MAKILYKLSKYSNTLIFAIRPDTTRSTLSRILNKK